MLRRDSSRRLLRIGVAAAALAAAAVAHASGKHVALGGSETRFSAGALGGITRVLRFDRARPDRSETAYVFLADGAPGRLPQEVQVLGPGGAEMRLADQESGCTMERVLVRRQGSSAQVLWTIADIDGHERPAAAQVEVLRETIRAHEGWRSRTRELSPPAAGRATRP